MRDALSSTPFSCSTDFPRILRPAMPAPTTAASRDPYKKLSDEEVRLARLWYKEDGMSPAEIAELLRRDKSTMTRLLVMEKERKPQGRPAMRGHPWAPAEPRAHEWVPQLLHSYVMPSPNTCS